MEIKIEKQFGDTPYYLTSAMVRKDGDIFNDKVKVYGFRMKGGKDLIVPSHTKVDFDGEHVICMDMRSRYEAEHTDLYRVDGEGLEKIREFGPEVSYFRKVGKNFIENREDGNVNILDGRDFSVKAGGFSSLMWNDFYVGKEKRPLLIATKGGFADGTRTVGAVWADTGETYIPCKYTNLNINVETDRIYISKEGKWGVTDCDGHTVVNLYWDMTYPIDGNIHAVKDDKVAVFDLDGNLLVPLEEGFDQVKMKKGDRFAIVTKDGEDFTYDTATGRSYHGRETDEALKGMLKDMEGYKGEYGGYKEYRFEEPRPLRDLHYDSEGNIRFNAIVNNKTKEIAFEGLIPEDRMSVLNNTDRARREFVKAKAEKAEVKAKPERKPFRFGR